MCTKQALRRRNSQRYAVRVAISKLLPLPVVMLPLRSWSHEPACAHIILLAVSGQPAYNYWVVMVATKKPRYVSGSLSGSISW